jgi:hypothetical protein
MPRKVVFHQGHNVEIVSHQGRAHLYCKDCGILADVESVSGEISPADAVKTDKSEVTILSKLSKGVTI